MERDTLLDPKGENKSFERKNGRENINGGGNWGRTGRAGGSARRKTTPRWT